MEARLISALLDDPAVSLAVGSRVYPITAPQGTPLPRITVHKISAVRTYHVQGQADLVESRVQVDCWGRSFGEAKDAARAIITALSGYRDDFFSGVFIDGERDFFDAPSNTSERIYRTSVDLIIWHPEAGA